MDHQRRVALDMEQQVLGAPSDLEHATPGETAAQRRGIDAVAQSPLPYLYRLDGVADDVRLDGPAKDFDFG
jgi:hypothetical protein